MNRVFNEKEKKKLLAFISRIILSMAFSFTTALVLIRLARSAYLNVDKVSTKFMSAGDKAAIMIVLL
jgi:hypothetical protein